MDPYRPSQAFEQTGPQSFGEQQVLLAEKHSSLGIASFVLSVLSGIGMTMEA